MNKIAKDILSFKSNDNQLKSMIQETPNDFFIGSLFNFMLNANDAWEVPGILSQRLGHFDPFIIAKMSFKDLNPYIKGNNVMKALHDSHEVMTYRLISACKLLNEKYKGNAANIWLNESSAGVILNRLLEFNGIGQKISSMITRLLKGCKGITIKDWSGVDIAVDRHVARVFVRSGLVTYGKYDYSKIPDQLKQQIIQKARELNPSFPGELDEPSFLIGRIWCTLKVPYCEGIEYDDGTEEESCPLYKSCKKIV